MTKMRKGIAALLACAMIFSMLSICAIAGETDEAAADETETAAEETSSAEGTETTADTFADDDGSGTWTWASDNIYKCAELGYVLGYEDESFQPDGEITRAEAAVILARIELLSAPESYESFDDDDGTGTWSWAADAIYACAANGIITGYTDGTFKPDDSITRAEMATMITRALLLTGGEESAESLSDIAGNWAESYISACYEAGIIEGYPDGTYKPDDAITRAEGVTMFSNAYIAEGTTDDGTDYTSILSIPYVENALRQQKFDIYVPDGEAPEGGWPVVVNVSGGGFMICASSLTADDATYANSYKLGAMDCDYAVITVYYRSPIDVTGQDENGGIESYETSEDVSMTMVQDVITALKFITANADALNINADELFLMGDSAGGGIITYIAYGQTDFEGYSIQGVAAFAPANHDMWSDGDWTKSITEASSSSVPYYIATGTHDTVCTPEDLGINFANALLAAGVNVTYEIMPDAVHMGSDADNNFFARALELGREDVVWEWFDSIRNGTLEDAPSSYSLNYDADNVPDVEEKAMIEMEPLLIANYEEEVTVLSTVVSTDKGEIEGFTAEGSDGSTIYCYYGIPYAESPTGELRWKDAQEKTAWEGVLDCSSAITEQNSSLQWGNDLMEQFTTLNQSEDCLYLNVTTPAETTGEDLPVIVWFHGGGLVTGSGSEEIYNLTNLPEEGCIVVTVTTRLGAFGLLSADALESEEGSESAGNFMISDMIAALEWVQENIEAFGGDPDNVTIDGESGGGMKVAALIASPQAEGLFSRAIIQSGAATALDYETALETGNTLMEYLGVTTLEEAQALPADEILEAYNAIESELNIGFIIDGYYLTDTPLNMILSGNYNGCDIMIGVTEGELDNLAALMGAVPAAVQILNRISADGYNAYAYEFNQVPSVWRENGFECSHSLDMAYLFGEYTDTHNFYYGGPWNMNLAYADISVTDYISPVMDEEDLLMSEYMIALWVSFAEDGNASIDEIQWDTWTADGEDYLYMSTMDGATPEMQTGFSELEMEFSA